jgi:hypothetical protein
MEEKVLFLGTKAQCLEKQMKEAQKKVKHLQKESSIGIEAASPTKKEQK